MRERKNIKLRVDMNDDTKFKIIDRKPERDLIYCIWIKLLLLAGKVNKEGELHLSKSIPYTIDTLSIEFNRENCQVKLAFGVFLELEMLEIVKGNVYKIKNFAKHQNIKTREQSSSMDDIQENSKSIDNGKDTGEHIKSRKQYVEEDIKDNVKVFNNEEIIQKTIENEIDINFSEKGEFKNNSMNKVKDNSLKKNVAELDAEKISTDELNNIKGKEEKITVKGNNDKRVSKNKINDDRNMNENILIVDKRKTSNSRRKNNIFKDGFQDVKEKYVSETWEGFGDFEEREEDKVIMKIDFSE